MPLITGSTYLNLVGVACCVFLLLSFAVLSVEYTNRHYLSVCLVTAILILQVCKDTKGRLQLMNSPVF